MTTRTGSVIIYFVGLAAIIVIMAYAFLRSVATDVSAGDSSDKMALAQSAARQGLHHAIEAIVRDVQAATLEVGSGSGSTVTINQAPTFIDGPYRAPFVSTRAPYQVHNVDYYGSDADIDVTNEHLVLHPLFKPGSADYYKWFGMGLSIYDGRGRYIEPNFHNVDRPIPIGGAPPVTPLAYTDLSPALPGRNAGLYLDSSFRRMDTGNALNDRLMARYRLRYALGVIDATGLLLSNPQPDFNDDPEDPNNDYRSPPPEVAQTQSGWYNIVSSFVTPPKYSDQANAVASLRAEHVFLGRGNASNFDRLPGSGKPGTFPMMFRSRSDGHPANVDQYWGKYGLGGQFPTDEADGLYYNADTAASAAGGVPLAPLTSINSDEPFISTMFGPQLSWRNHFHSVSGWLHWNWDGISGNHATGRREDMLLLTPFGRGLRHDAGDTVNTPWNVNLLTAPPNVINAMLLAYLPASVKTIKLTRESYKEYTGLNAFGHDTWGPVLATNVVPEQNLSFRGRDLFTRVATPAFALYSPPSSADADPNYQLYSSISFTTNPNKTHGERTEPRLAHERYPGRLWNGNSANPGEAEDNMGAHIDVDTTFHRHGLCSHTREPLLSDFSGSITFRRNGGQPTPLAPAGARPAGWGDDDDTFTWSADPTVYKFNDSYWWDIYKAFSTAAAFVRAQWVQYPNPAIDPETAFDPASLRDPAAYTTIAALDRLFLRQLGENIDAPGSIGSMQAPVIQSARWDGQEQQWQLGAPAIHNIRSLLDADLLAQNGQSSLERSKVMEMVLNDFRMSFFGANPEYAATFRPLDFNGDGHVQCSAYAANIAATADEIANGTNSWKLTANAAVIDHPFSLTGCFFIGKSRSYRVIVRGEVWDNLLSKPVSGITLEALVAVDPDGNGQRDTHIPYQRWHFNRYAGEMPLQED